MTVNLPLTTHHPLCVQALRAAADRSADIVADPDFAAEPAKPVTGGGGDAAADLQALAAAPDGGDGAAWDDGLATW